MKKLWIIIVLIGAINLISAQHSVKISAGYFQNSMIADQTFSMITNQLEIRSGYTLGLDGSFGLGSSAWSIAPGIHYSNTAVGLGASTSVDIFGISLPIGVSTDMKMDFIEMPLHVQHMASVGNLTLEAGAGVGLGYALSATLQPRVHALLDWNLPSTSINLNNQMINRSHLFWSGGVSIGLPVGQGTLSGGIQYQRSITDLLHIDLIDSWLGYSRIGGQVSYAYHF